MIRHGAVSHVKINTPPLKKESYMFDKINNYASRSAVGASGAASNYAAHAGVTLGGIYAARQSNANINNVLKTMTDPVPTEIHGVNGCALEGICHTNPFKDDVKISARIDFNGGGGAPRKVPASAELKKAVAAANQRVIAGVNTHLDVGIKQMKACLTRGSQKGFWSVKHTVLKVKNPDAVDVVLQSSGVYAGKNIFSAPPELSESYTSDIFGQSIFLGRPKEAIGSESSLPGNGVNAGNVTASIVLPKGGAFHSKSHVRLHEQSNGPTLVIPAKQPSEENTPQYVMDIINQQAA